MSETGYFIKGVQTSVDIEAINLKKTQIKPEQTSWLSFLLV